METPFASKMALPAGCAGTVSVAVSGSASLAMTFCSGCSMAIPSARNE
jgi:hypothetical protein